VALIAIPQSVWKHEGNEDVWWKLLMPKENTRKEMKKSPAKVLYY
jgi:hypothetical protein